MGQKRPSPAGQDSEPPRKKTKRQAQEEPEFGINDLPPDRAQRQSRNEANNPNQSGKITLESSQIYVEPNSMDIANATLKKAAENSAPSRQNLIASYMKLSMPVLQFQYGQIMNKKPEGSKKDLATGMADKLLGTTQQIPEQQTPPPPSPQPLTGHEDPMLAQPGPSADDERPGKEFGSPELSLEEINFGRSDRNFEALFKFWYQLFTSSVPENQQVIIRPEQSEDNPEYLDDDTIARGIIALIGVPNVREHYGLIAPSAWELAGGYDSNPTSCQGVGARFVRPRCPGIFSHTYTSSAKGTAMEGAEGHHIVARVQMEQCDGEEQGEQRPRIYIFDSAPVFIGPNRDAVLQDIERRLHNLQWLNWPLPAVTTQQFLPYISVPVPRQFGTAECGVHAILNGWVATLGLNPVADFSPDPSFYWYVRCLINMGINGFVDTRTIYSFLHWYRYIRQTDTLPAALDVKLRFESDGGAVQQFYEAERDWEDFKLGRTTEEVHPDDLAAEQNTGDPGTLDVNITNQKPPAVNITKDDPAVQASKFDQTDLRLELHRDLQVPWSILGLFTDWELEDESKLWKEEGVLQDPQSWFTRYPAALCSAHPSCSAACLHYFEESDE